VFGSNVQPKRRVRQQSRAWSCACPGRLNRGYLARCMECGVERDGSNGGHHVSSWLARPCLQPSWRAGELAAINGTARLVGHSSASGVNAT
jgi:hypothetical protein